MTAPAPDLLVVGTLHTLDPSRPRAEAALLRGGVIARLGSEAECTAAARPGTPRLDLGRGSAVPGLVDAHGHVQWLGRAALEVSCAGTPTAEACAERVAERARATAPGAWIRGRGWDQNRWPGAAYPDAALLSRAVPDRPVFLTRVDGHMAWVNHAALAAAGIGAGTADPPGGRVVRDAAGQPTGILVDAAMELVLGKMPRPSAAELEEALVAGLAALPPLGLTGVHDAGCDPDVLDAYERLATADRLPVRVYAMIDGTPPLLDLERELLLWHGGGAMGLLDVRAVKLFADGALGSRGAALLEDYADDPGNRGILVTPVEVLRTKLQAAISAGLQPAIHAIGDRANRDVLLALRDVAPAVAALRPRIEHLQLVQPVDLALLRGTGAIASMQPVHATSDGPWIAARLGEGTGRVAGAYAWRTLQAIGAVLAFGSDFPVESPDPRAGLHAAETRLTADGSAFAPEEAVSRLDALRAFTSGAAYAAFAEGRRGLLREGFDADLTVFGDDILAAPAEAVPAIPVTHTIVAGRIVFERSGESLKPEA